MNLQHLQRTEIDTKKWDDCLAEAQNSRPYGFSWYLDATNGNDWSAVVLHDDDDGGYEAVMPLPFNHKMIAFAQVFNPIITQQLGIFYKNDLKINIFQAFFLHLEKNYRYVNYSLNSENLSFINQNGLTNILKKASLRKNQILDISKPYGELVTQFNSGLRARLRQTTKNNLQLHTADYNDWKQLFQTYQLPRITNLQPIDLQNLESTMQKIHTQGQFIGAAKDGSLLAVLFFIQTPNRITILLNASSDDGRRFAAVHFLIHHLIQTYAEQPLLIDFEGSEIVAIADFNRSFGATDAPYLTFQHRDFIGKLIDKIRKR